MQDRRLKISLDPPIVEALRAIAERERRTVPAQAAYFLVKAIAVDNYERSTK